MELRHEVVSMANQAEDGTMLAEAFTEYAMDAMTDTGDWPESQLCYHRQRGSEISGWGWDPESGTINLAVTRFAGLGTVERLSKSDAAASLRRLRGFLERSLSGFHDQLEESSPAFDLAYRIHESADAIANARLFLLTDMVTNLEGEKADPVGEISTSLHVWDLARLHRLHSSGRTRERIDIDIAGFHGEGLRYLEAPSGDPDLKSFLLVMPGQLLADLYVKYGPQLLELNVRSFLQARGKVNRGIRQTIIDAPERIFAYNNGISATASGVRFGTDEHGGRRIVSIEDLQIVNGGQTTASIATVHNRDKQPVEDVFVQAKLTVVPENKVADLVPKISRFANSQNAVSEADLTANDAFHVQLEKLSRTVWAPAVDEAGNSETRWFYERARGQYADALARERTPARKKNFRRVHPSAQKFTKTDVAKFENTWSQKPHIVSRGAQKSFFEFMDGLTADGKEPPLPGVPFFQQLCAKALMYKSAEKIVGSQNFGGYRANIVTYTLSRINLATENRLDLHAIWMHQKIGPELESAIEAVSYDAFGVITRPPGGQNVTEWCKKSDCWERMMEVEVNLDHLGPELISEDTSPADGSGAGRAPESVSADDWRRLTEWIEEERNLSGHHLSQARLIENSIRRGRGISPAQRNGAAELVRLCAEHGFEFGEVPTA
ncbi:MAG: AIPR family protein [Acidimicrobiales bacterium]